ncbi:MAG: sigma-70 family RNA polymerase sigma factor [Gemmatimonadaceae bacterium]|nr:sigma-70 family RNA polymerase sigma factor [Gemmatimonadaceae bacterium]
MDASASREHEITVLLRDARNGDRAAYDRILPLLYDELRDIAARHMRHERESHTLQPTALLHEALLRILVDDADFEDRAHLLRTASRAMRHVLVDHARSRAAAKRGGALLVTFDDALGANAADERHHHDDRALDILALEDALVELAAADARCAQVVDLRVFAGLGVEEIARILGVSTPTVKRDWAFARAWLAERLSATGSP